MSASKYDNQPTADAKQARDNTDPTVKAQSSPGGIHIADLPERYEDGRMVLLARDPTWLYAYWDLTAEQHRQVWTESRVVLRVIELKEGHFLREVKRIQLTRGARSWYCQIDDPGCVYQVELGVIDAEDHFRCVLASNPSTMPPSAMADTEAFVFATYQPGQTPKPASTPAEADQVDKEKVVQLSSGHPESGSSSADLQKGDHVGQKAGEFLSDVSSIDASRSPKKR